MCICKDSGVTAYASDDEADVTKDQRFDGTAAIKRAWGIRKRRELKSSVHELKTFGYVSRTLTRPGGSCKYIATLTMRLARCGETLTSWFSKCLTTDKYFWSRRCCKGRRIKTVFNYA